MDLRLQLRLREDQRGVPHLSLPHIAVACGVLQRADGHVLLAQRPPGKLAAGKWEFPGGKIESGETAHAALARELREELGIDVTRARPLIRFTHAYSDRVVTLDTWLITAWQHEIQAIEGQRFAWHAPDAAIALDLLPTVQPILAALRLPTDYVFTPADADEIRIRDGLRHLPAACLLRLRLPLLDDVAYVELARAVIADARGTDLRVVLDRGPAMAESCGAAGWHQTQAGLSGGAETAAPGLLRLASCHDAASLQRAREIGCDAVVLGSVRPTSSHPGGATLGWDGFSALAGNANLPVYALGGVGPQDRDSAFAHHAQGVAGISAYWSRSRS